MHLCVTHHQKPQKLKEVDFKLLVLKIYHSSIFSMKYEAPSIRREPNITVAKIDDVSIDAEKDSPPSMNL